MKKIFFIFLSIIMISVILVSCVQKEKTGFIGVNAEILEVINEQNTIIVKGLDENSVLGDKCFVNCLDAYFVEVIDEEPIKISFNDLKMGDIITVDIVEVEESYPGKTMTERVQLIKRYEKSK